MILIGLPGGVYLSALSRRLTRTCSTRTSSMGTSGKSGGTLVVTRRSPSRLPRRVSAAPMTSSSGCHSLRSWSAPDSSRVISRRFWTRRFSRSASSRTDRTAGSDERQVEGRGSRQRGSPEAGDLAMLVDPATDAVLVGIHSVLAARPGGQTIVLVGKKHGDGAVEDLADVPDHDGQERVDAARARQLATHRVERRRALLALARGHGLRSNLHRPAT